MVKKNFDTFVDFGTSGIRASSFKKRTKKVENHLEVVTKNQTINNLSIKEELIEKLVFNLEKKNGEYLDEICLMVDSTNILSISITIFNKSDEQTLNDDLLKYIIDDAKYQINENYLSHDIIHIILKNFFLDEKKFSELPRNLTHNKFAIEFIFILCPKLFLDNLKEVFAKQNVIIKKFIFSSYSKSLFYLNEIDNKKKVIFVDIGFEKTCAFLFENRKIEQFKILPIGGNHISKDISKILKIELFKADEIKLNFDNIDNDKLIKKEENELIKKIVFSRIEELLEISTLFLNSNNDLKNIKLVFFGNGSKILDNRFKSNITFNHDIDLLDENYIDTCLSGLNLVNNENEDLLNQSASKEIKKGFFERFFHLFS